MRSADKTIFSAAATQFYCWILVRQTNPHSLRYIGRAGYVPKPMKCKAKTTDNGGHPVAGLVASPELVSDAFTPAGLEKAKSEWTKFKEVVNYDHDFAVVDDRRSDLFGCVTYQKNFMFGDYDLKDVILADQMHRNLALVGSKNGQLEMRGPRLEQIKAFIRKNIGVEMVQHGADAQFAPHAEGAIDAFGPGGEFHAFPDKAAIEQWYQRIGREVIDMHPSRAHLKPVPPARIARPSLRIIPGGKR